jgi:drug/metabolite transporter (DMT)-like permease
VQRPFIALIAVQVLYALLPAAGKTIFVDLEPLSMTAARILGGTFVLMWIHVARGGRWPLRSQWPGITKLAFFGIIVNMSLFAIGLRYTHPLNATLLITTIPVFTYIIALITRQEGIGPRRLAGILLAFSGAMYLIGLSGFDASIETAIGDTLVLINALSFSIFLVLAKPWMQRNDVMSLNVWMFVAAAIMILPVFAFVDVGQQFAAASNATLGWIAFVILGPTVGAYALNATALRQMPSSTVAVFIFLQPPVSAVAAWLILDILPSWKIFPAAVLILAGVTLVARRRHTAPTSTAAG